jgi:MFS family permease
MENPYSPPNPIEPSADLPPNNSATSSWQQILPLAFLFGTLYFVQGISEPTEGLIAQPVRSMLDSWGHTTAQVAAFGMILSLPWTLKPLFGLISDFVPLFGLRRKSYLIATSILAFAGLIVLYLWPPEKGSYLSLLAILLIPTTAVAFADVVIDALMVEKGQPLGITGRLQSIQWGALYGATILTGTVGGQLTAAHRQDWGFLICAVAMIPALIISIFFVHEKKIPPLPRHWRTEVQEAWQATMNPQLLAVAAFIFLWNFNPFSSTILQLHMRHHLKFDDEFYGYTVSLQAIAAVLGCITYGLIGRHFPRRTLAHGSIVLGILSTISYWLMENERTAIEISIAVGFIYMIALLIQLELAARVCPPRVAGTVFALLMSISNLAVSLSTGLGGFLYDEGIKWFDSSTISFNVLVAIGASFTACCWLLTPWLTVGQVSNLSDS